jgi:hypothetical protein
MGGYKSALKLYYSDKNVEFTWPERPAGSQCINDFLDAQIKSYGNLVNDKELRAVMSLHEGKTAMTHAGFGILIDGTICKHKKDQDGSGLGKQRAMYANPLKPKLCLILAFGVYLISKARTRDLQTQKTKLFEGHSQRVRFADLINEELSRYSDEQILQIFGTSKD